MIQAVRHEIKSSENSPNENGRMCATPFDFACHFVYLIIRAKTRGRGAGVRVRVFTTIKVRVDETA